MDDLYREFIIDHYRNPRNIGVIEDVVQGELRRGHAANEGCGDALEADILVEDGKIVDFKWRGTGCAISQATTSVLSEWIVGKSTSQVESLTKEDMLAMVGLEEIAISREKCLLLSMQLFNGLTTAL